MKINIYVHHFSNFYFPSMDLKNSKLCYSDLTGFDAHGVHIQDCFQGKSNKICLGSPFHHLCKLQTEQAPTLQISVSEFQRKMMPCASKTRTTSLCSELEYSHAPSSLPTAEIRQKACCPQPITATDPATQQPAGSAHTLSQSQGLQTLSGITCMFLQVVITHIVSFEPL